MQALPKLNTEGNDQTNTIKAIHAMRSQDIANEGREKQNRLLDLQLSPEMQAALSAKRDAELSATNALIVQRNLENSKKAADQVRGSLDVAINKVQEGTGQGYVDWYHGVANNPLLKEHASILPDPQEYMDDDLRSPTGQSIPKEKKQELQARLKNLMSAAERKAQGFNVEYKQVHFPDGKSFWVSVAPSTKPGEVLDAEKILTEAGYPNPVGASFSAYKEKKATTTPKPVKVVGDDGKVYWETPESAVGKQAPGDKSGSRSTTPDAKLLLQIDESFTKPDKNDNLPYYATDKNAGKAKADEYNRLAEELGRPYRYVWKEDAYEQEIVPEDRTGIVGNIKDGLRNTKEFFAGKDVKTEKVGGWVKEKVGVESKTEAKTEAKADPTEDEVKAMKPGTKFTVGGKTYVRK